ncbi:MAG: tetratricopeptide repeat protein, partial [Syntrophothermus sp.]
MKNKFTYLFVCFVLILSAFYSSSLSAQENQMPAKDRIQQSNDKLPVTTSSPEARQEYTQALNYLENSQIDKARSLFQEAIKADQNFALAYMGAALTAASFNESKEYFDKAENLVGQASEGEKHLVAMTKAQFEANAGKGKTEAQQLDNMYPNNKQVQFMIGQFYFFMDNERDQAIAHLQKAVSIDDKYAPAYNLLGYAYSDKNDFTKAENAFKKYISLIPDNPNPYDSYAELLLKNGRYDESIQQYEKALSIDPQFYSSLEG